MDVLIVLASIVLVPVVVGSLLARYTSWPRFVVASIAGAPLPLVLLIVVLVGYADALATPPERCGFSCGLNRTLAPPIVAVALGGMAIAVAVAFLTATSVRRRRR